MNTKIKNTIIGLALGLFAVSNASAYEITDDDIKDYIDEMSELSYQLPAIDCNDAAVKISTMGAWWAIQQKWDVRKDPKIMAMTASLEISELASKMDLINFEYIDRDNKIKGAEEVLETYKGFFIAGAYDGAQVNKKLSLKKTKEKAKEIGWANGEFCKAFGETNGNLKVFIAYYRLHKGEF